LQETEVLKNSVIITAGTTLSKFLGFAREIVIAAFFGATYLVDAYLAALVIPMMLFSIVNQALTTTVVPLIIDYGNREGTSSVLKMLNSVTTFFSIILAIFILFGEFFAELLVQLVAPGFSATALNLTKDLTRILLPIMLFLGLAGIGSGILQSKKRFIFPAFIGIPYNVLIIIAVLLFGKQFGINALAIGTLIGVIGQWLFQVPDLRRNSFRFRWGIDSSHPGFKQMGRLILPVVIGSGAAQINVLVDRIMASGLVEGSISALNYANRLSLLIYGIIAIAVANAVYPEMAEAVTSKRNDKLVNHVDTKEREIATVFPNYALFPHMTVYENMAFGLELRKVPKAEIHNRVMETAKSLDIEHLLNSKSKDLSHEHRQWAALSCAIVRKPKVILMDEPLAALDEARKIEILPYIERLRDETKIPIVYVSHSVAEVARLATDIVALSAGKITAHGAASSVLTRLDPSAGEYDEASALIELEMVTPDDGHGLSLLRSHGGEWWLPKIDIPTGARARVRVRARDVMLATTKPQGISALNVIAARISAISNGNGTGGNGPQALVRLEHGDGELVARVTRRSLETLALAPGQEVFAIVKAVTFDPGGAAAMPMPR